MMSVQTIHPGEFTFDDLDALPDDGLQYELVDGMLLVTPAPTPLHQRAVVRMSVLLDSMCPPSSKCSWHRWTSGRPRDDRCSRTSGVSRREDVGPKNIQRPLLLAVAVLSDSTRSKDRILKRALYAEAGVPSYWVFDPQKPELAVLELDGDKYLEQAVLRGSTPYDASLPFEVRVVPDEIIR